ncbi:uncharacterized protein TNCV_2994171 [Trichonephila clavipes]|nr:uncharacterized protein TNCV_2994171 [Trichonephila clavipes]
MNEQNQLLSDKQEKLSDEDMEVSQVIKKVLVFKSEQVQMLSVDPNGIAQPVAVEEEKNNAFGSITDQYERQSKYVRDLCNSVNINQMFKEEVVLFPPYLLKESTDACSKTSGVESLKEIKAIALKSNNISNPNWSIKDSILDQNIGSSHYTDSMFPCDRTLNNLVDDISSTLSNLHNHASEDFTETYNKLKLYLDIPPDNTIDIGPSFEAAKLKSETFLQLKDAVSMLQSSEIEQKRLNSELQSFEISSEPLSDVLLGEYISILNEEKDDQT